LPINIDIFIDYVCPFCFLIEPMLDEVKCDRDVEVTIRPFELRPAPAPTLRPTDDYLPRVWREVVYPMAERFGIPITLPTISPQPRTEKAFLILQLAREVGRAEAYSKAIFSAFFQENRDIGESDVIRDVATSVGLDPAAVLTALASEARREQHHADLVYATKTLGITAVPGIMVGDQLVQGVPSADQLKKMVDVVGFPGAQS
jgi:predicted dithiol-disulfide isomerase involved in polyketide biosynthesis